MLPTPPTTAPREATRLSELTPQQKKSGLAAWLGWTFDGLELHLYTLVAGPPRDAAPAHDRRRQS